MKYIVPILLIFICLQQQVFCQQTPIETDRPDQTESPYTVPVKWVQLEMGLLKQANNTGSLKDKEYHFHHPALLTKYGLFRSFELRLITELASTKEKFSSGTHTFSGLSNLQAGGKINFFDEKGWRPKTSLIFHYDFARLRSPEYSDSINGFNFRFTMQHTASSVVSISYNVGMRWNCFGSAPAFIYTFAPGFAISEKWYVYIEAFGSAEKGGISEHSADGGAAYAVNNNFKLDISAGMGINKEAPAYYFSLGASIRFKTSKSLLQ